MKINIEETWESARIRERQDALEKLLDQGTLMGLLENLAEVCYLKASHVSENWQDVGLSSAWNGAGRAIDKLAASKAIVNVLPS